MSMQKVKVQVTEVKTNFALFGVFPDQNYSFDVEVATKRCTRLEVV